jgi:CRP/FNR family transcriptional regulator
MHHGESLCNTRVRCIPHSTIDHLISAEPGFGHAMLATLATELSETRDQLLSLGRKSALEKVATFLLRISRRNQREKTDECQLHLPMTRAEIADYLGLTIETISRSVTKLKTSGLIRLESKSRIQITDLEALEALANGE